MTDTQSNDPAPQWYIDAMATERSRNAVDVAGASINYLHWGDPGRPGLLFIHGGAAHSHWWSHIAPTFLPEYQVAALDLSGHGDSDHRENYDLTLWADEVKAVTEQLDLPSKPILIGHSMGGFVTMGTAALLPDLLDGAVIIDSPVRRPDPEVEHSRSSDDFTKPRAYPDPERSIQNFRTIPGQDVILPFLKDHVARNSLRQREDGLWEWKFDPMVFSRDRGDTSDLLANITCRVALLRCEHGLVTEDIGDFMYERLGRVAPVIELPTAGHHPMLDVPLILITALRSLLADWDHSHPLRRV